MSLSGLLNIAKTSLHSHGMALNVTGSNIANVNTPGYSRQRPEILAIGTGSLAAQSLQIGVKITEVKRLYDGYLEGQIVRQSQMIGYGKEVRNVLGRVEAVFEESGGKRLNEHLNRFWTSWGELAGNPTGTLERYQLISAAETLVASFREYDATLEQLKLDLTDHIKSTVAKINDLSANLADLNTKMMNYMEGDGSGNQLEDQRLEELKKLGNYLGLDFLEDERRFINIFLPNGLSLVEGIRGKLLRVNEEGNIYLEGRPDQILNDVIARDKRGALAAMVYVRDTLVPAYQDQLDRLAAGIVEGVNAQHRVGFDQRGNTGRDFFVEPSPGSRVITRLSLNINNPLDVAASGTVNKDGQNAGLIAGLKDKTLVDGLYTANQYLGHLLGRVGNDLAEAIRQDDYHSMVMNFLVNRKESVSGVSMDEEMINLMKYQLGYNAAGRMVQAANELLDTLMNLGR